MQEDAIPDNILWSLKSERNYTQVVSAETLSI